MKPGLRVRWVKRRLAARGLAALVLCLLAAAPSLAQIGVAVQAASLPPAQAGAAGQAAESRSAARRAITLAPHITELIFAAGAGSKIAATVISSNYPAAALAIPRIGDGLNISVEKALAMHPDLVIAWQPSAAAQTLAPVLTRLDIPLLYSAPRSLRDIPAEIIRFGTLFNTENIAVPAARALSDRLQALAGRYAHRKPVSIFIEVGAAPLYTIGSDPLLNDALRICGGINIYAGAAIAAPQVSAESILVARPQAVITSATGAARLDAVKNRWSALRLPAALQGHVYGIDPDQLFRPGPRLIDATEKLCQYIDQAR